MTSFSGCISYCTARFQKETSKLFSISPSVHQSSLCSSAAGSIINRLHWTVSIYSESLILQMEKPLVYFCSGEDGFTSYSDANVDHGCCSVNPCMGCALVCRRSPRLLTNGYYVLTEDSFLFDEEGNITLSPSQTSVTYKEKLVRIFRKRRKIRKSLVSLFNMAASNPWMNSTAMESPHAEDTWSEEGSKTDCLWDYDNADHVDHGIADAALGHTPQRAEGHGAAPGRFPPSKGLPFAKSRQQRHSPCVFPLAEEECSYEKPFNSSESIVIRNELYPMILLSMCLIISLCVRFFLGVLLPALLTCSLLIIILICSPTVLCNSPVNANYGQSVQPA
ncbi:LOW QUALITY PROTEIN: transmembrane protein 71 [Anolis sagrei]|uniref:LOW QUALITY PROTEIN: transmembrane protein 71 n=1 Tax=Anolis sagrei TaxID=38937 RepID=UPI0035222A13